MGQRGSQTGFLGALAGLPGYPPGALVASEYQRLSHPWGPRGHRDSIDYVAYIELSRGDSS